MANNANSEYVGVKEAAEILGLHYLTVLSHVKKGILKSHRIGKLYKIPRTEVLQQQLKREEVEDDS